MAATETKARPAEQRGPSGLAMEIDAPRATPRPGEQCAETCMLIVLAIVCLVMLCFVVWLTRATFTYKEPEYSIAIAAVSGLDPAPDRPVLYPEFNLTVRIAVRSPLLRRCDEPYTTVQVSYHGAEEGRTVVRTVVARGTRVWLRGAALDSLTADMRRAAGVFDVTLTIPGHMKTIADDGLVVSCLGRPIGDDGGSALCDVSWLHLT